MSNRQGVFGNQAMGSLPKGVFGNQAMGSTQGIFGNPMAGLGATGGIFSGPNALGISDPIAMDRCLQECYMTYTGSDDILMCEQYCEETSDSATKTTTVAPSTTDYYGSGSNPACNSDAMIRVVQRAIGVEVDGKWGPNSAKALAAKGQPFQTYAPGCTGAAPTSSGGGTPSYVAPTPGTTMPGTTTPPKPGTPKPETQADIFGSAGAFPLEGGAGINRKSKEKQGKGARLN